VDAGDWDANKKSGIKMECAFKRFGDLLKPPGIGYGLTETFPPIILICIVIAISFMLL